MHQNEEQTNKLIELLEKRVSLKSEFVRGLVSGVGRAIGMTVIVGLLIWILIQVVRGLDNVPVINELIPAQQIERYIGEDLE